MRAMILAAGLGTRLKPFTDFHPKALAMVNGKSLLQRNVEYLQAFGINEVVVNVHHFADQIMEAVETNKGWGSTVTISDESSEVLETGGGVVFAKSFFEQEENWLVMNADILTNLDIDKLIVKEAYVGKGLVMKRFHARARGRGAKIIKPFSHLTILLSEQEGK